MTDHSFDTIVVGAGLAGLAAAHALSMAGARIALLERKPFVGGRAYSYMHPALEEEIDCQHVLLGCCTNLRALLQNAEAADRVRWYNELTFLRPGIARRTTLTPGVLPAPLHTAADFLRAPMLDLRDKFAIARGLAEFLRGYPKDDGESFAAWLKRTGQTERAIRHLWEPVVVGALNDTFDNCSTKYAGQVFFESFLKSPEGGRLGIPAEPLSRLYTRVAEDAVRKGCELRLSQAVDGIQQNGDGTWTATSHDGATEVAFSAPAVVLAVPFQQAVALVPRSAAADELQAKVAHLRNAPITTVHLWFDREITALHHAVLLNTGIQWIFNKSRIRNAEQVDQHYVELTISASFAQLKQSREDILTCALRELQQFFPLAREAKLIKSGILKEARATFSVTPGLDQHRPSQATSSPGLVLAGDWTQTGWPSTMEGAVRSGYLAAEAVSLHAGHGSRFLHADLPPTGLMRFLAKS